jgi:Glycosyl hydrolases family 39
MNAGSFLRRRYVAIAVVALTVAVLVGVQVLERPGSGAAAQTSAERSRRRPRPKPRPRPTTTVPPTTVPVTTTTTVPATTTTVPVTTTTTVPATTTTTTTVPATTTTTMPVTTTTVPVTTTTTPPTPGGPRTPKPFPTSPKPFTWVSSNFADPFVPVPANRPGVSGQIAPDWTDNSEQGDVEVAYSSTGGHLGGTAQRMNVTAVRSGRAQTYHALTMVTDWRYEANVWMKGSGRVSLAFQQGEQPYSTYGDTSIDLTSDWRQVRFTGLVTSNSEGSLIIFAQSKADISFDDIEIRAVPQKPSVVSGTQLSSQSLGIHEGRISEMALRNRGFDGPGRIAGNGTRYDTGAIIRGNVATGWNDNSFWADVTASYAIDSTMFRTGPQSQRIEVGAIRSGAVQIGQNLSVKVPSRVRFSQWIRGAAGTSGYLQLRQRGVPYAGFGTAGFTLTGEWQLVTAEADLTAQQTELFLLTSFDVAGTYWIDDATVVNLTTGTTPDWIAAPSVGGTMRLWDTSTTWSQLEPQRGVWDFSLLDRYVELAERRQQDVLLTLGQSPAWATKNANELSYYGLGSVYGPSSIDDWRNMVKVIATRYRGRIDGYEIWNEPNDSNFGKLTVQELFDLTKVASEEIRSIDPAAKVVSIAPYSVGYLDAYLATGAADYVDIIAYHYYSASPENMLAELSNVRFTLEDYSVNKPIWLTEGGSGDETQGEAATADALLRWNLVAMAGGMQRAFWYTWGPAFNLAGSTIKLGSWEPNAAFVALADMQQRIRGRTLTKSTHDAVTGRWVLEFTSADGNVLTASWTRGGTAPSQPVAWS